MLAVSDFLPSSLHDNIRLFSYNGHIFPNAPLTCWVFDIMHALQLVVQGVICAAAAYVLRYRARFPSYFASPGRRILGSGSTPTCLFRGAGLASDSKHTFERKWARRGLAGAALSTFLAFVSNALSQYRQCSKSENCVFYFSTWLLPVQVPAYALVDWLTVAAIGNVIETTQLEARAVQAAIEEGVHHRNARLVRANESLWPDVYDGKRKARLRRGDGARAADAELGPCADAAGDHHGRRVVSRREILWQERPSNLHIRRGLCRRDGERHG